MIYINFYYYLTYMEVIYIDITSEGIHNLCELFKTFFSIFLLGATIAMIILLICLTIFIFNYIISSHIFYTLAEKQNKSNAYWAWIPILRDLLTIEMGQGNKLLYLPILLIFIPKLRTISLIIIFLYITLMKYKIIRDNKGYSLIFGISSLILLFTFFFADNILVYMFIIYNLLTILSILKMRKHINAK